MSDPRPGGDDAERDLWLREALRHAPDAEAAPPPALRDSILAQARAAARTAAPAAGRGDSTGLADRIAAFWSWLARPPVAAGFASVMAATLVGMLWWDRPIDETLPQAPPFESAPRSATGRAEAVPPAVAAPAPDAAQTSVPRAAQTPLPPAAQTPVPPAAQKAVPAATQTPAPAAAPAPRPPPEAEQRAANADRREAKAAPPTSPPESRARLADRNPAKADSARDAETRALPADEISRQQRKDGPAVAGAAGPAAAKQAAPSEIQSVPAPAPAPFPADRRREADADAARAPARSMAPTPARDAAPLAQQPVTSPPAPATPPSTSASPPPPAARPEPFALAKKAEVPRESAAANGLAGRVATDEASGASALRQREVALAAAAAPTPRPLAETIRGLGAEPARWTRARPEGVDVPVDPATRAWLAELQAAATRWDRAGERLLGLPAPPDGRTLLLRRDGQPAMLLRLEETGVHVETAAGAVWFAALPAELLARLRRSMPPIER